MRFAWLPLLLATLPAWPATAWGASADAAMPALPSALREAEQGRLDTGTLGRFARHPLHPWLAASNQRARLQGANAATVSDLLQQLGEQPAADWLRQAWLRELARRKDWPNFLATMRAPQDIEQRCHVQVAHLQAGTSNAKWAAETRALWLTGRSLPGACDTAFAALEARGGIDAATRWQRIELAADAGETGLMRFLAGKLPARDAALARDYADFIDAPHARAQQWPRDARSRQVATVGLQRLAKRDPDAAEAQLPSLASALGLDAAQQGRVRYELALWTVASYAPGASKRLAAVPSAAYDDRLHEWRLRDALNQRDTAAAVQIIAAMPDNMRRDARWQYFEARLREQRGEAEAAQPLFAAAATQANFHGFLAADRLQQPYTLCPLEPPADPQLHARIAALPGLQRALALFAVDRRGHALREWNALLPTLTPEERLVAIELAQQAHWYDRAIFSLGDRPEDLRQYRLRFPLHHADTLTREAQRHALDPAWVAALTRAESAFMPEARSHANARGLMQLLPGTAQLTARRIGTQWNGAASLYQPRVNLQLGTAHLRFELDKHQGLPHLAMAAYNAGPTPVARWQQERGDLERDYFIETINYRETRDYVARVSAFSVIYDWRLHGAAVPLSDRLGGIDPRRATRRAFHCPSPDAIASIQP
ncbi:MAG TPA: transglycosylase SLT domain-containing protein [Arenimonas sp.]|nr:transglycosylase SLT domain-containing protein [Arenimonas sp.]